MSQKPYSYEREQDYYSRDWPKQAQPYQHLDEYLKCWMDPHEIFGGKTVLDIGAGECTYARLIADRFAPRQVVACELFHQRMLPAARANLIPNLKFVVGDAFRLPFADRLREARARHDSRGSGGTQRQRSHENSPVQQSVACYVHSLLRIVRHYFSPAIRRIRFRHNILLRTLAAHLVRLRRYAARVRR